MDYFHTVRLHDPGLQLLQSLAKGYACVLYDKPNCAVFQDEIITKLNSQRLLRDANKTGSYTAILFLYPAFEHRKNG